jgi:hypothetical protein
MLSPADRASDVAGGPTKFALEFERESSIWRLLCG